MKTLLSLFLLMVFGIALGSCSRTQETSLPNAHAQDVAAPTDRPKEDTSAQSSEAGSLTQATGDGSEKVEDSDVERIDGLPAEMQPWRDPNNRNVQILDEG